MGKWDKIKAVIGIPDDNDVVGDEEVAQEEPRQERVSAEPAPREARRSAPRPVAPVPAKDQVNMVIVKSSDYSDARTVAEHILDRRAVLLNLENCNKEMAQRILDFLSGVVYAQHGDLQRVAHSTYAVTPQNVGLQGELLDNMRSEEF